MGNNFLTKFVKLEAKNGAASAKVVNYYRLRLSGSRGLVLAPGAPDDPEAGFLGQTTTAVAFKAGRQWKRRQQHVARQRRNDVRRLDFRWTNRFVGNRIVRFWTKIRFVVNGGTLARTLARRLFLILALCRTNFRIIIFD